MCPHIDACINNGNVFLNTDGEENRGYRNLPRYSYLLFSIASRGWCIFRIGGSVLDVKKWIESGSPVDLMSTLNSIVAGNSSASNIQKLFAGMMFVIMLIDSSQLLSSHVQPVSYSMLQCN